VQINEFKGLRLAKPATPIQSAPKLTVAWLLPTLRARRAVAHPQDLLEPLPGDDLSNTGACQSAYNESAASADGRSLLHGEYDEAASAQSFQEALRAWRGGPAPEPVPASAHEAPRETAEEIWERAQRAAGELPLRPMSAAKSVQAGNATSSSSAAAGTQAGPKAMSQMSFFERLQEQKRRDGLL